LAVLLTTNGCAVEDLAAKKRQDNCNSLLAPLACIAARLRAAPCQRMHARDSCQATTVRLFMTGPWPHRPFTFRALQKTFGPMWVRCDVCRRYAQLRLAGLLDVD